QEPAAGSSRRPGRAGQGEAGRGRARREGEAARARSRGAPARLHPPLTKRRDGAGDREGGCPALHGRRLLQPPQQRRLRRPRQVRGPRQRPRSPQAQFASQVLSPQVGFEDVIAEPVSTHSFDKVWICSHALFEMSKYVIYKFLTVFLAIPLAFAAGILFATLSCLHIWIIMPFVKTCLMVLPSVQTIWKSVTDVVIAPLCTSVGRSFSSVSLQLSHD
uniref:Caveolin 2 n=1 Tax=Ovis aries TaxID=9940 RepID=A0AC11AQ43_SHEEP